MNSASSTRNCRTICWVPLSKPLRGRHETSRPRDVRKHAVPVMRRGRRRTGWTCFSTTFAGAVGAVAAVKGREPLCAEDARDHSGGSVMDVWLNTWATFPATVAGCVRAADGGSVRGGFALVSVGARDGFLRLVRRFRAGVRAGVGAPHRGDDRERWPKTSGDGLGGLAFAVYTFVAVVWVLVFFTVVRERRHTPTPTPPIERKH